MQLQLPVALLDALQAVPGFDRAAFVEAHAAPVLTSIRLNPAKQQQPPATGTPVAWHPQGFYLAERPVFTLDPLLHAGAYYVQEASSMFLYQAIQQCVPQQPLTVLDLCAAPGGKSTLLQAALPPGSLLVSNEVIKTRAGILTENITKWGGDNVVVTNNDPAHFARLPDFFDVVVVDAPCSGSGLWRRDAQAINEWSTGAVTLCSQRQQRILADVLPALKPGGLLVYATCSYSREENEDIVQWLLHTNLLESRRLALQPGWGITATNSSNGYGYRFFPHRVMGEGFFLACFVKTGSAADGARTAGKTPKQLLATAQETAVVAPWLTKAEQYALLHQQDDILALPAAHLPLLLTLQSALYIKKAGIRLGKVIGSDLVPAHELALSSLLSPSLPVVEATETMALQYLRRQDFDPATSQQGWCRITYQGLGLGWVKLLHNRLNNYYPKEWRILMQ